jgi:hypothetical protein
MAFNGVGEEMKFLGPAVAPFRNGAAEPCNKSVSLEDGYV